MSEVSKFNLSVGETYEMEITVEDKHTAKSICSGCLDVFASPIMFTLMEEVSFLCVEEKLGNYTTVGIKLSSSHIAATPVGMKVKISATLVEIDGRRLVFDVLARDEKEIIGKGKHERFIIDPDKFMKKVEAKGEK